MSASQKLRIHSRFRNLDLANAISRNLRLLQALLLHAKLPHLVRTSLRIIGIRGIAEDARIDVLQYLMTFWVWEFDYAEF